MVRRREALAPSFGKWLAMAVSAAQVLRKQRPLHLDINGEQCDVWALFVGNGVYSPRGLFPAWRPRLDDSTLDVQFLRADATLARTRVVLATLAGTTERRSAYRTRLLSELEVTSRTRPVQVAHDGEPGPWATSFRFRKLPGKLVVYRPATH
jgi:diacylglycerol kinase family enzyme